ncbi:MAG: DUF1156 domain-containing protein [Thermofilaceae archaeon]
MRSTEQALRFIESPNFPIDIVNQAAAKEKSGGGGPEFWEMVFWWTRKPLASARAVLAAAALPADINPDLFIKSMLKARVNLKGIVESVLHKENPTPPDEWKERLKKMRVLDPFAGFGSIPLEAMRLGFGEVIAVELLPTAYVFLKAVLEYPSWAVKEGIAQELIRDVERWGNWIIERLKEDPDIKELYDPDVAVYIGTWEVKCPHCGKYTPLIGNWWLARVKKGSSEDEEGEEGARSGVYQRLAWMDWDNGIRVVDLNMELKARELRARVNAREGYVEVGGQRYIVRRPNVDAKRKIAICLHCCNQIRYISLRTGRHSVEKPKEESEWYVKRALKDWNRNLEAYLNRQIELEDLLQSEARPRLLIKVRKVQTAGLGLSFETTSTSDEEKLLKALEKLRRMWGGSDIPTELIPEYEKRQLMVCTSTGACKWYKLFNFRQLLTLVKLVKLIREAGKKIEEEKQKEGQTPEEAQRYAEALVTYFTIALCKYADFNSVVTRWNPGWLKFEESLSVRGIAVMWNWVDSHMEAELTGTFRRSLKNVAEGLQFLIKAASGSPSNVKVVLDDATILGKIGEKFDLIITDPPYYDDVPYTELSDFYYVWLKRALSDVKDDKLVPRFLPEAFFKRIGDGFREVRTQWEELAMREVGLNPGRVSFFSSKKVSKEEAKQHYVELLLQSFKTMRERLAEDGLLVTYYAHTDPEAWEDLISAGWRAGLRVSVAFPVATESAQRVIARGKSALDTSIVVVWRPGVSGEALADEVYREALMAAEERALQLLKAGRWGMDLFVGTLSSALAPVTARERIIGVDDIGRFVKERIYPLTARALARAVARLVGACVSGVEVRSPEAVFYLLAKLLLPRGARARARVMDRSSVHILGFGIGLDDKRLAEVALVQKRGEVFRLLEPAAAERDALIELLRERGLDPARPVLRTCVDALHLLEFYALTLGVKEFNEPYERLRSLGAFYVDEAVRLAEILASERLLPAGDPERELCRRVVGYLTGKGTLEGWL